MAHFMTKTVDDIYTRTPPPKFTPIGIVAGMVCTPYGALALAKRAPAMALWGARTLEEIGKGKPEYGTPVVDTRAAFTMRQAALQAMHDSAYSLRAVLGREARMMHS